MLTAVSFYLKRVQLSGMTVADDHRLIMARSGIVPRVTGQMARCGPEDNPRRGLVGEEETQKEKIPRGVSDGETSIVRDVSKGDFGIACSP